MTFADRLEPVGRILDLTDEDCVVWTCSPIRGPDGLIHVFFNRVPGVEKWFEHFRSHGEIVHATAEQPEGPYTIHEVVRSGTPGSWYPHGVVNPRIYAVDGRFALFYVVYHVAWPREAVRESIGLLVSDDCWHWQPANNDQPVLSYHADPEAWDCKLVNNPSLVIDPASKEYRLYYRGVQSHARFDIGLASATALEGPYQRHPANPLITALDYRKGPEDQFRGFEDPCVWIEDGCYHMLCKDMGWFGQGCGAHFTSGDGINWSRPDLGYHSPQHYWGEEASILDSPQLLFDAAGRPSHLFVNRFSGGRTSGQVFRLRSGSAGDDDEQQAGSEKSGDDREYEMR